MDGAVLEEVKTRLAGAFSLPVRLHPSLSEPSYAFEPHRCQFYSTKILKDLESRRPPDGLRMVGITDVDLCTAVLTFVFGEAQLGGTSAVVSLARLRQEFYRLPTDPGLVSSRAGKEAVHEVGHTFGLTHCAADCVMHFSPTVAGIDQKRPEFCPDCREILEKIVVPIRD